MRNKHGFTLIELLVVVAIIVALLAILMPSLNRAIAVAQDAQCRSQQHQVVLAFLNFTGDHFGKLPGGYWWNWVDTTDVTTWPWFGAEVHPDITARLGWGHTGTLAPYLGLQTTPGGPYPPTAYTANLYRCPAVAQAGLNTGLGSNGMFDYSSFLAFAGAKMSLMPSTSQLRDPTTGLRSTVSTPLLVEESAAQWINSGGHIEMGHGHTDAAGLHHLGGGTNVGSIDGSVSQHRFKGAVGPTTYDWSGIAPSGAGVDYSANVAGWNYGGWNRH